MGLESGWRSFVEQVSVNFESWRHSEHPRVANLAQLVQVNFCHQKTFFCTRKSGATASVRSCYIALKKFKVYTKIDQINPHAVGRYSWITWSLSNLLEKILQPITVKISRTSTSSSTFNFKFFKSFFFENSFLKNNRNLILIRIFLWSACLIFNLLFKL